MPIPLELIPPIVLFCFVMSITPGPNNMMLLASGVNFGFKRTLPQILGVTLGGDLLFIAVGSGLGQLFKTYPDAYTILKWVGFAYLLYLAWQIAFSSSPKKEGLAKANPIGFFGAMAFQWVNPKLWVMALGFFTNYIPFGASIAFMVLGIGIFGLVNFPCITAWALLGTRMETLLKKERSRRLFNYVMAGLLVLSMLPVLIH